MVLLTKQFADLGHAVTVLTRSLPDGGDGIFEEGGGQVHYLTGLPKGKDDAAFWAATAARFDDLHAQSPFDLVVGRSGSPYGYFKHSRYSGQVPVILHEGTYPLWLHQIETRNSPALSALIPIFRRLFWFEKPFRRHCFRQADRVVCNSPALARALVRADPRQPPKATFIPYGFDSSRFAVADLPTEVPPRLVFVGRLTWDKGILKMIDILAALDRKDVTFEAIGPVSALIRAALTKHAMALGVADRFLMPGAVKNSDLPSRLAGALAFVFPSTHPEGLSKAVLEAMAAGLPVVAYDIPGQDTLVAHGVTGWLERPRALPALIDRINALIDDPITAARMGAAGRRRVEMDFAPPVIDQIWTHLLQQVQVERLDRA